MKRLLHSDKRTILSNVPYSKLFKLELFGNPYFLSYMQLQWCVLRVKQPP